MIVLTTASSKEEAEKIAKLLLDERLCACVQLMPIESYFHWQGKVEHGAEVHLAIKSKRENYEKIEAMIKKNHSYKVPEILMLRIEDGYGGYLRWIDEEVK